MTDREALELSLTTLERDNLKVGNIYINYDIQKALIKLVKKKLEKKKKKEWVNLTVEERETLRDVYQDSFSGLISAVQMLLKEKNT